MTIDPEFGCLSHAEWLADTNPLLTYVEGRTRLGADDPWGDHAWCVRRDGTIVDPYFAWRFGPDAARVEYRELEVRA